MNCSEEGSGPLLDTNDRDCLAYFYGFLSLYGVPGVGPIPDIQRVLLSYTSNQLLT